MGWGGSRFAQALRWHVYGLCALLSVVGLLVGLGFNFYGLFCMVCVSFTWVFYLGRIGWFWRLLCGA